MTQTRRAVRLTLGRHVRLSARVRGTHLRVREAVNPSAGPPCSLLVCRRSDHQLVVAASVGRSTEAAAENLDVDAVKTSDSLVRRIAAQCSIEVRLAGERQVDAVLERDLNAWSRPGAW